MAKRWLNKLFGLAVAALLAPTGLAAAVLEGEKTIYLVSRSGEELAIGTARFRAQGEASSYELTIEGDMFSEHFLSMRPFRCIEDAAQTVCHLPYPHALRRQVSGGDLTDLEYDLLFLHKASGEYGINFWNGIYYRLSLAADGSITGALRETDMNELASPPAEEYGRLIGPDKLSEADGDNHRFPKLVIR